MGESVQILRLRFDEMQELLKGSPSSPTWAGSSAVVEMLEILDQRLRKIENALVDRPGDYHSFNVQATM